MAEHQYIYLLKSRECIAQNLPFYKVGRTSQPLLKRFEQYPKGSKLLLHIACSDSIKIETEILRYFKERYENKSVFGSETFAGDYKQMMRDIYEIVMTYDKNNTIDEDENPGHLYSRGEGISPVTHSRLLEVFGDYSRNKVMSLVKIECLKGELEKGAYILTVNEAHADFFNGKTKDLILREGTPFIMRKQIKFPSVYSKKCFDMLLSSSGCVHDYSRLRETKRKLTVEHADIFLEYYDITGPILLRQAGECDERLLYTDILINDSILATGVCTKKSDYYHLIDVELGDGHISSLYKIGSRIYDLSSFLVKFFPRAVRIKCDNTYEFIFIDDRVVKGESLFKIWDVMPWSERLAMKTALFRLDSALRRLDGMQCMNGVECFANVKKINEMRIE